MATFPLNVCDPVEKRASSLVTQSGVGLRTLSRGPGSRALRAERAQSRWGALETPRVKDASKRLTGLTCLSGDESGLHLDTLLISTGVGGCATSRDSRGTVARLLGHDGGGKDGDCEVDGAAWSGSFCAEILTERPGSSGNSDFGLGGRSGDSGGMVPGVAGRWAACDLGPVGPFCGSGRLGKNCSSCWKVRILSSAPWELSVQMFSRRSFLHPSGLSLRPFTHPPFIRSERDTFLRLSWVAGCKDSELGKGADIPVS